MPGPRSSTAGTTTSASSRATSWRTTHKRGLAIEAGWIVVTGGMTDAVYSHLGVVGGLPLQQPRPVFISGGPLNPSDMRASSIHS